MKIHAAIFALAVMASAAFAQEAPEKTETIKIPKTKGAYMVLPLNPPTVIQFTSAATCEAEKERQQNVIKVICIWVQ